MNTKSLLAEIDTEIVRLQQARKVIVGLGKPSSVRSTLTFKSDVPKKRTMSAEGKARIAAAQKKRWAAQKKASK